MQRALSESWFCDSIWRMYFSEVWRRKGGTFFSETLFPGVVGNIWKQWRKWVFRTWLSGSSLSVCALCLEYPSLYHIKFLPFQIPGQVSLFSRELYYLYSALTLPVAHIILWSCCRFSVCCLCSCVCLSFWYPGMILGQRLGWNSLVFAPAEYRTWCLELGSACSQVCPPLAHRGHSVQGADRLSVQQLRWLLNPQRAYTENSFWLKPYDQFANKAANIFRESGGGGEPLVFVLQPRYVPWLGIKLTTFWCMRRCSNQLSHTSQVKTANTLS